MDLPLCSLRVICRGILVSLSTLYRHLLELLREVANSQPMPFLTDFSLPADMTQFLGPFDASLLTKQSAHIPHAKDHKETQQKRRKTSSVKVKNQGLKRKVKEDVGVAVERGVEFVHFISFSASSSAHQSVQYIRTQCNMDVSMLSLHYLCLS